MVDAVVGPNAILHMQRGFTLASAPEREVRTTFRTGFHRDFPRYLNGHVASVNPLFAVDAFTADNGATIAVPATSTPLCGALPAGTGTD